MTKPLPAAFKKLGHVLARERPLGVWVLGIGYIILPLWKYYDVVQLHRALNLPWPANHTAQLFVESATNTIPVFTLLLLGGLGIFLGIALSRYLVIGALAIATIEAISTASLNNVFVPALVILWLALNYWYLFGSRTKHYFAHKGLGQRHA